MPLAQVNNQQFLPAWSVYYWWEKLIAPSQYVLDYGAGNLRNSRFLAAQGGNVWAVDLPSQVRRITEKADWGQDLKNVTYGPIDLKKMPPNFGAVICTYVLNIVAKGEQARIVSLAGERLIPGGYFCIEVRPRTYPNERNTLCSAELKQLVAERGFLLDEVYSGSKWLAHLYRMS